MTGKKLPALALIILSVIVLSLLFSYRTREGDGGGWRSVISSDGRGYYAYLPSFLLYHDTSFDSCAEVERKLLGNPDYLPEYIVKAGGRTVNKYFAGVALLQLPFFITATAVCLATGVPVTGYSLPFQVMAGLAALFYLFAGLWFLSKVLERFTKRPAVIALVLAAFTLGTNLLYYAVGQPLMSHVYSFFAVNGFLYATVRCLEGASAKWRMLAGLFLGTVILIRPVNAVILLTLPFLAGSITQPVAAAAGFLRPAKMAQFLLPVLAVAFLQPLAWNLQCGRWWLWSYGNEGFDFLHPAITEVLFGFRKGLFVYTPLTFVSLAGFIYLYKWKKTAFFIFLIFFIFFTFLTSSWWNWYYGDSFGMRPVIDLYGFFAILLAIAADRAKPALSAIIYTAIALCIILNLFQSWQYTRGIIHPYNMDRQKYGYVFLRTANSYRFSLGGSDEVPWYGTRTDTSCYHFTERIVEIDSLSKYNTGPNLSASLLPVIPGRYWLSGSFYVRDRCIGASNEIWFVMSIYNVDSVRGYWYGFRINDIPVYDTTGYRFVSFSLNSPVISNPDAFIKTYLWNPKKKILKVVDFVLDIYPPGPEGSGVEEHDSVGRNALLTADKAQFFSRLGLDR